MSSIICPYCKQLKNNRKNAGYAETNAKISLALGGIAIPLLIIAFFIEAFLALSIIIVIMAIAGIVLAIFSRRKHGREYCCDELEHETEAKAVAESYFIFFGGLAILLPIMMFFFGMFFIIPIIILAIIGIIHAIKYREEYHFDYSRIVAERKAREREAANRETEAVNNEYTDASIDENPIKPSPKLGKIGRIGVSLNMVSLVASIVLIAFIGIVGIDDDTSSIGSDLDDNEINRLVSRVPDDEELLSDSLLVMVSNPVDFSALSPIDIEEIRSGIYVLQFPTVENASSAFDYLFVLEDVVWVEFDTYLPPFDYEIEPLEYLPFTDGFVSWGGHRINAESFVEHLHQSGQNQNRIVVAVLDTGVDANHPALQGRVLPGWNAIGNNADSSDPQGHGTHVAGVIADITSGLNVYILPVRVLGEGNRIGTTARGIQWAVENGANVINLSLGTLNARGQPARSDSLDNAVMWATAAGVMIVASAGNNTLDANGVSPAGSFGSLTVAATDINDNPTSFTNWGEVVNVAAPGSNINSMLPNGRFGTMSGTSMAAPHVSAAIALYMLVNPDISPAALTRNFERYVDVPAGWNNARYGAGVLNLGLAVPGQTNQPPPITPTPPPVQAPPPAVTPGTAAYFGMSVERLPQRYELDHEAGTLDLLFPFHLGATREHDVRYTARLLDASGDIVARWDDGFTIAAGSTDNLRTFRRLAVLGNMTNHQQYTFIVRGEVFSGGEVSAFRWEFDFTHAVRAVDFGINFQQPAFRYVFNDDTNVLDKHFPINLSATGAYDIRYTAQMRDTDGNVVAEWSSDNWILSAGSEWRATPLLPNVNSFLTVGETYTFRIRAHFVGEWFFFQDFDFVHNP
ncbi:MAG: S8 family peptidase [Turicibacter sp.]|nr:S8 family peptidase [Turicibacter sp.]